MWKLWGLLFLSCARQSVVVSLSLCNQARTYLEVKEGTGDNIFTCTGFTSSETVRWWLSNEYQFISQCPPLPSSCNNSSLTHFTASRTSGTTSRLTVNTRNITNSTYFGTTSLSCGTSTTVTCQLDLVYPAENSRCQAQFIGNTWQVNTWCSVSKVRSARHNYRCYLYKISEASLKTSVGYYTMNVVPASSGYFSGTCNMTSSLPPEGRYSYYVIIMPGEVNVSATFIGNNTISRPRGTPYYYYCPQYLKEGDNLTCSCFISDPGNPPGILRWSNTNSNRLELRNLQKSQNGIQSVCSLIWNNAAYQSVSYTLIVAYRPTWVNFTMNSKESQNISVVENSTITMRCEADGRPAPRMTITKVRNNSILKTMPEGNITVEDQRGVVTYTVGMAQCSDSDTYRCTAANIVGMKEQSIHLIVQCRPRGTLYHNCSLYKNEGDTLSCLCFVSDPGNPPGFVRWNNTNSNRLELRNLHKSQNGIQSVCSLIWNNTVYQSVSYTLIVAYRFTRVSLTMNSEESRNVSVVENSMVTMKCEADGIPTPRITFTRDSDNSVLKTIPEGSITMGDQGGVIIYTVAMAQCSDTDKYRCTAANSLDMKQQSFSLFVKCKPRRVGANPRTPIIMEGKTSSFELIAYPNSVTVTKYFIGSENSSSETPVTDDIFRVDCTSNCQQLYKLTCTVTVIKVTVNTAGLYKAVVSNDLGSVALTFEALPPKTTENEKSDDITSSEFTGGHKVGLWTGLGVGLGLAGAEAVVVATVVLVFCKRRKQRSLKAKGGGENTGWSSQQQHENVYEVWGNGETERRTAYANVEGSHLSSTETTDNTESVYDVLRLHEEGSNSPYVNLK